MRLHRPFVRLPLTVDADALAAEIDALPEDAWRPHPEGATGNTALPLIALRGDPEDDGVKGPMAPTAHLTKLPYTTRVLAALGSVVGRTRLMRIEQETELASHVDTNYYWWEHLRVHVPVHTTPDVQFQCGRETVHMEAGEVWVFDTWRRHRVDNPANSQRVHLVIDTVGGPALWNMIDAPDQEPRHIDPNDPEPATVVTEARNHSVIMSPWEIDSTLDELLDELTISNAEAAGRMEPAVAPFRHAWRTTWAIHGDAQTGWETYKTLVERAREELEDQFQEATLPNGISMKRAVHQLVLGPAVNTDLAPNGAQPRRDPAAAPAVVRRTAPKSTAAIEQPIIIVSPPRSGSSLLFETLARSPRLYTIGGESHGIIEGIRGLHPRAREWESNQLPSAAATPEVSAALRAAFGERLRDPDGKPPSEQSVRMLEKTPKNALRVPFLNEVFQDATFVYLYRDPRETVSSMLDAWRSEKFVTYPDLPGWEGPKWSMLLTPGWRELSGRSLAEIVTTQWSTTVNALLDDLERIGVAKWCVASYDRLVADPAAEIGHIAEFCDLEWNVDLSGPLPLSRHTLDSPHPDKWKRNADELEPEWERVREAAKRAHDVFAQPPRIKPHRPAPSASAPKDTAPAQSAEGEGDPLRSVHTGGFPELLKAIGSSLLVSTYQSGHLVSFRVVDDALNTHFRRFPSPMGIAFDQSRLALGTKHQVVTFQNQPAVTARLEPKGRHDACFVPRASHVTGDIRIHDLAYAGDELWIVNTRFSCLATLDDTYSFVPRWRPPFITGLAPEDRCHLNGLCVIDGVPRFVTALGMADEQGGWREKKTEGGVVLDIESGDEVASGLCMPHSPRWHDNRLWILESGKGTIGTVDLDSGKVEDVAQLPGFTRGLAFAGPYAFVGLSQVREHLFEGLPLTEEGVPRISGVWVVDTRTGDIVGFLRFEGNVREIYEVAVLPGIRVPEIAEVGADLLDGAFMLSEDALAQVPESLKT